MMQMNNRGRSESDKRPGSAKPDKPFVKRDERRKTGMLGEAAACDYLERAGYSIIARNWRCRTGEIDIVASFGGTIVFVEVRTRGRSGRFGTAAESIDARKRRQVMETAQVYMRMHVKDEMPVRFDAIAIRLDGETVAELFHYEGAL